VRHSGVQCPMAVVRVQVEEAVVAAVVAAAVDLVGTRRNGVGRRYRANGGKRPDNLHMFVGASNCRDRRPR
jgi:hypothetical protein